MGKIAEHAIQSIKDAEIIPLVEKVISLLRQYLRREDYRIFLFGSWVSLKARPTSDIDIAVMGRERIDESLLLLLKEKVDLLPTLRSIEIVDLNIADSAFRDAVLSEAEEMQ